MKTYYNDLDIIEESDPTKQIELPAELMDKIDEKIKDKKLDKLIGKDIQILTKDGRQIFGKFLRYSWLVVEVEGFGKVPYESIESIYHKGESMINIIDFNMSVIIMKMICIIFHFTIRKPLSITFDILTFMPSEQGLISITDNKLKSIFWRKL